MKRFLKKVIAVFLAMVTIFTTCISGAITTLAANYSTSYSSYNQPESNDFAYWNGKKVVKGSGTTTSEIKWMQAALNYCISKKGLNASKLDVDGSFGPASKKTTTAFQKKYGLSQDGSFGPKTISKMKSVLNSATKTTKYNLIWPTNKTTITGKYGTNGSKRSNGTRYHSGIDIGTSIGSPCYAVADGTVVMCKSTDDSSNTIGGRGRYIVIYHSNGDYSSLYEHLSSCSVKVGDKVKAGQKIGKTGNSGWQSKGKHYAAHLHFGLMKGKMTSTGYDLWTVAGKKYNGKTYSNKTFDPDPHYNSNIKYSYK